MSNTQEPIKMSGLDRFLVTFQKGEIIFFEHDTEEFAYMVKQGKVRLLKIINGIEKFIATVENGDFFGEMSLLTNNPRSATAIAIEETQAFKISKVNFELLVSGNAAIATKMLTLSAARIQKQRRQLQILLLDDDETQVLDALLMLYEQSSSSKKDDVTINITPYELTTWAGVTLDIAKRILASYQASRRIAVFPDRVIVQNISELERLVSARRKAVTAIEGPAS